MYKLLLILVVTSAFLNAKVTLKEIESKPACHARNFLIWQYLRQDISSKQVERAYKNLYGKNRKVTRLYRKKTIIKQKPTSKNHCKKKKNILEIKDDRCFKSAINSYITLYMNDEERKMVAKRVKESWRLKLIKIQSEPYKASAYKKYDSDTVLRMFLNSPKKFREKNLDMKLDKRFINRLSKSYKFSSFVKMVLADRELKKLRKSLFLVSARYIDSNTNFPSLLPKISSLHLSG